MVVLLLAPTGLAAGERKIVLHDRLKHAWKNELVRYPFEAERA